LLVALEERTGVQTCVVTQTDYMQSEFPAPPLRFVGRYCYVIL
jgi:hypothetical protein